MNIILDCLKGKAGGGQGAPKPNNIKFIKVRLAMFFHTQSGGAGGGTPLNNVRMSLGDGLWGSGGSSPLLGYLNPI